MSDLERKLEDLFTSDARARRVQRVDLPVTRPGALHGLAFLGGVAVLALAVIGTFAIVRVAHEHESAASPKVSAPAAATHTPAATATTAPASSQPSASVRPDTVHGLITFEGIRTEADARNLQQPPEFTRIGGSFTVGVSPDGTRVAVVRSGQTGSQLVMFSTDRPKDVTIVLDFAGTGETPSGVVWAGDGADSVLMAVHKVAAGLVDPPATYSTLRVVDLRTKQVREVARITNGNYLEPLAWRPDRRIAAAAEVGGAGIVGFYDLVREGARTDVSPERTALSGVTIGRISASRDGTRIVTVPSPNVQWWPVDEPSAAKQLSADSKGRAESAAFRPGSEDELGVNVTAPVVGNVGLPPPAHFEVWNVATGAQRVVSPSVGFQLWRVDGSAAITGTTLIDPSSGDAYTIPGGALRVVDVVRFAGPVAGTTGTPQPTPARTIECSTAEPGLQGQLRACPATASVGERLTISGSGCNNPGAPAALYFGTTDQFGQPTQGTYGAGELGQFAVDSDGRLQTTIQIPTRLGSIQGQGGGDVKPGLYAIYSKPDLCRTYITVR